MYKLVKQFKVTKEYSHILMEDFYKHSIVYGQPGFKNIQIGINDMFPTYDVVTIEINWENKDSYLTFLKSPEHIKAHDHREPNPNIINHTSYHYQVRYEK